MKVEFVLVENEDDLKREAYTDAFLTLEMPMPPRVGEWFVGVETTDVVGDFDIKDVSYVVNDGVVSSVVFCHAR